ncbi:MAG: hypothetical protein R3Y18_00905 [Bacillota bacterium]
MKKFLALLMVLVFCFSAFGMVDTTTYAADYASAPLMPTVEDDDEEVEVEEEVVSPGVVDSTDTEILDTYSEHVVEVDHTDEESVETFTEILNSSSSTTVSTESAKEIMEIISTSTSETASVLVVSENSVLSVEAIQATVAETGNAIAIVSTNTAASTENSASDFVVVTIASEDASSLTKSVSMDINVTTTQMSGTEEAIDVANLAPSSEADTVVFDFSSTGNFGAPLSVSSAVSMSIPKADDGSYPALSIYSTSGESLGSADISGLATSETGKITIPMTISDSVVAQSTISAFSIAGVRVAFAATQYAEVTGSVADDGSIAVTNITIVSDTIVPVVISTLSSDELFVSASTGSSDTTLSPGTVADDSTGISPWVWMIAAVAVLALVLVVVLVIKKKQA